MDVFDNRGDEDPVAAGHVWLLLARKLNAAAMRPSFSEPKACVKSSATEHPGTDTPLFMAWLAGEKPSL